MTETAPRKLGLYDVEYELGRGGMGVVYLARDPRLNRQVAVKVLPDPLAQQADSLARFRREAMLLAAVNHPNVAAVYDVQEDTTSTPARQLLVMEYVPGETLAGRLARGPLSPEETIDVGRQIAAGLEAAHERGVIHRDLKPGNVKLTPDGVVKVLDFGLARGDLASGGDDLGQSPTLTYSPTGIGVILGTAGYMSPEQARGKPLDRRTDVWSFGCVLFECLTGRRLFDGETVSDTIARILEREPDWSALPANTPARLTALLRRCLERDPRRRQRDMGDVGLTLDEIAAELRTPSGAVAASAAHHVSQDRPASWRRAAAGAGLLGLALAVGAALGYASRREPAPVVKRLSMALPSGLRPLFDPLRGLSVTSDGRRILFVAVDDSPNAKLRGLHLYQRALDGFDVEVVPGTAGVESFAASPDSQWVAIIVPRPEAPAERRVMRLPIDGRSPPAEIGSWNRGWNPQVHWLADGDLLAVEENGAGLHRLSTAGGEWRDAGRVNTGDVAGFPQLLGPWPGGRVLMMTESWGGAGYQADLWTLDPATGSASKLVAQAGLGAYSSTGHVVFSRNDTLMAAPLAGNQLELAGDPVALVDNVRTPGSWQPGTFALTPDGSLIFPPGGRTGLDRRLILVDAEGAVSPFSTELRGFESPPEVSADGSRVAVVVPNSRGTYETWVAERGRAGLTRAIALANADADSPAWSPDGRRLAFARVARDDDDGVMVQDLAGGAAVAVYRADRQRYSATEPTGWLADGRGILVNATAPDGHNDVLVVPLDASGQPGSPRALRATPYDESWAAVAPNGRLVAYASNESGRHEIYVAPLLPDGSLGTPLLVSRSAFPYPPAWTSDSRRLFYSEYPERIVSVSVSEQPGLSATAPALAYDLTALRVIWRHWALMPDGRLLAIQNGESERTITRFDVVLDWFTELRARMQ